MYTNKIYFYKYIFSEDPSVKPFTKHSYQWKYVREKQKMNKKTEWTY